MEWLSIAVSLVLAALALARSLGADAAGVHARLDAVDATLERFLRYHQEFYDHISDENTHWTKRERDALQESIAELHRDVRQILQHRD